MKFRTEIEVAPLNTKIDHCKRGFSIGSCFADRIATRLVRAKFPLITHSFGTLFNPFSIVDALESTAAPASPVAAADYVLITFGTAWVYEENGRVVANCGKRPAHLFTRRRLSVEEITERFSRLFENELKNKQVIFTVSPIRHLKDGFEENSLGKAILRLAVAEIVQAHPDTSTYFPAFEILNDDLRDYRFYAADLAHPSEQAVEYIWEKFAGAAFDACTTKLLPRIEAIVRATEHRPFEPGTEAHKQFRSTMLGQVRELAAKHPELDLSAEMEFFTTFTA